MKQTAVKFFEDELKDKLGTIVINKNWELLEEIIQQAKAMEKEQIIEAWDNGFANGYDLGKYDDQPNFDDAEQYYSETFKSE